MAKYDFPIKIPTFFVVIILVVLTLSFPTTTTTTAALTTPPHPYNNDNVKIRGNMKPGKREGEGKISFVESYLLNYECVQLYKVKTG